MDVPAKVTSKGQVTIPKAFREHLGISAGDRLIFRVQGDRVVVARTPDLLELAGSVDVPVSKRGTPWDEILRATRHTRVERRR